MEEWRSVVGYEDQYIVSNTGRVRSLDRYARVCGGGRRLVKGKEISVCAYPNGYKYVNFAGVGFHQTKLVHRLVAEAFLPNPDKLPQVNHKDENIENNEVSNLEWCTSAYNANYGTRNKRCRENHRKQFKPVYQIDKTSGERIRRWDCMNDAARECGICAEVISRACRGILQTAAGYRWEFAND